ncbi:MAG TPA: hypothetical protein VMM78_00065 [Thermomicrobiales bacterium]|nr:hypothetical protein [Thermomicrobiales bacterium]
MTHWPPDPTQEQIDAAVAELKRLVLQYYPDARFRVECGIDDPKAIHLVAIMDFEDTFDVLDRVSDRVMEIQIDDGVPIFVIPLRPNDRTLAMMSEAHPLPEALLADDLA